MQAVLGGLCDQRRSRQGFLPEKSGTRRLSDRSAITGERRFAMDSKKVGLGSGSSSIALRRGAAAGALAFVGGAMLLDVIGGARAGSADRPHLPGIGACARLIATGGKKIHCRCRFDSG
jgi:hypothetical protein